MTDYIKREDAYRRLTEYYHHTREIQHESLRIALIGIPSADVALVRHGEWKFDNETVSFFCSECNAEALLKYVVYRGCIQELSEYCPNCGARMDGNEDE